MLELDDLFRFIDGGAVRVSKRQQMQRLRGEGRVSDRSIMIGDRAVDLVAAHSNGLSSAGVLWGYGSVEELSGENPRYLIETPRALDVFLAGDAGPLSASVVVP